jgi:hypothetical protein
VHRTRLLRRADLRRPRLPRGAYPGSDPERARAAVNAARKDGGGVVLFGPRTYRFSSYLLVSATDEVVLRGAGAGRTLIAPGFEGARKARGRGRQLIVLRPRREELPGRVLGRAAVGERTVCMSSTRGLEPGRTGVIDESRPPRSPRTFEQGVQADPGSGTDLRYPWDANEIVVVKGDRITLRYPLSFTFTPAAGGRRSRAGYGDRIERMTLQGAGPNNRSYYQLLSVDVAYFTLAEVRFRWANRSFVEAHGYDIRLVGLHGPDGGAAGYGGSCKYKLSLVYATNVAILGGLFGQQGNERNQSFVTIQKAGRVLVPDCVFLDGRTYRSNEQGGGSPGLVFENDLIAGPSAGFGGILLGNSTWEFSGRVIVRNNLSLGNSRDLYLTENSYGTRFLDNVSMATPTASSTATAGPAPIRRPTSTGHFG